ncbi:MAG: tRNA-dihydrouridine synthase [Methanobacteriaceae archaeon]
MAGITDGTFALKLIPYGFNVVTLGGYNIDSACILAGESISKRGRTEFNIPKSSIYKTIKKECDLVKNNSNAIVSINLRSKTPNPIIELSNIPSVDIIEINAHCRQEEIVAIGCGQAMVNDTVDFKNFIEEVVVGVHNNNKNNDNSKKNNNNDNGNDKNKKKKVSIKIRANIEGIDTIKLVKAIEEAGADYIHIDAMKPGKNSADLDIIRKIANNINIPIIGNNSINSKKRAEEMINAGASGISIARMAINGKLDFELP